MRASDLTIFGSFFNSHTDTRPQPFEMSWADFVATMTSEENFHTREKKFDPGWGFSLARFVERGGTVNRDNAHVDMLSGVVLDFDKNYDLEKTMGALGDIVHLAYTTFSHTTEAPRWRVVVPLRNPIPGFRFKAVRYWLVTCLNGGLPPSTKYGADEQAKAVSNFYFAPGCPAALKDQAQWQWSDDESTVLLAPAELFDIKAKGVPQTQILGSTLSAAAQWDWLKAKMHTYTKDPELRKAFKAVLKGESFAEHGSRDTTLTRMCGALAGWAPGVEPAELAKIFSTSLTVMEQEHPDDLPPSMELTEDKIARAQASLAANAEEASEHATETAQVTNMTPASDPDDFEQAAANVGLTGDELRQRLILRQDTSMWVWRQRLRRWEGPINEGATQWLATRELALVPGVNTFVRKKDGTVRAKTLSELAVDYAEVVSVSVADLKVDTPHYDIDKRRLTMPGAELRPLEPEYDAEVDAWLELLGNKRAGVLKDWIAGIRRHDRPNCVLFIPGDPGVGKSLLVRGLARIWDCDGATDIRMVMNNFNDELRRCPLVVVEEGKWNRFDDITTKLRRFVTDTTRSINKKHLQTMELSGHLRLMVTANNFNLFAGDQYVLTRADRDAIAQRFLEINPDPRAADFLNKLDPVERDGLAADNRIAKHALWLAENRKVTSRGRFWVEGEIDGTLADNFTLNDRGFGAWVTEWIARWLGSPIEIERTEAKLLYRKDNRVIVNAGAIVNTFEKAIKTNKRAETREIADVLKALSNGTPVPLPHNPKMTGFEIRLATIIKWADDHGVIAAEDIIANAMGGQQTPGARFTPKSATK